MNLFVNLIIILSLLSITTAHEKIKLSDIKALTLNRGLMTNGRRSQSVPQLECVGGSAHCKSTLMPNTVQCLNVGSDGYDAQWKCEANLASNLKFGKIDINCEGFDYPSDAYVLKGSCGLRYTLDISGDKSSGKSSSNSDGLLISSGRGETLIYFVVVLAVIGVVVFFLSALTPSRNTAVPPPYGFVDMPSPPSPPAYESIYRNKPTNSANDGPGFWTGMGVGGVAGYMMGSRGASQTATGGRSNMFNSGDDQSTTSTNRRAHHTEEEPTEYRHAEGHGGTSRR